MGWGALVPCNGIPLVLCVNKVMNGKCFIGVTPDHRAFDGNVASKVYDYLIQEMNDVLQEEADARSTDRGK